MHCHPIPTAALLLLSAQAGASSPCFISPEAAASSSDLAARSVSDNIGFRLKSRRWDPLIGRNWVTVESCARPDLPAITLPAGAATTVSAFRATSPSLLVRPDVIAGQTVQIRYTDENVRIEMSGIAQQSGNPGDRIRVRLTYTLSDASSSDASAQNRIAIVRGPHSLELQP